MEWVETTGRTLEEAKEAALDQLGVDEVDAEFEIVEEPKAGLFGRVRGEARVRARVRPTSPRPKEDRRDRRRRGRGAAEGARSSGSSEVAVVDEGSSEEDDESARPSGGSRGRGQGRGTGANGGAQRSGSGGRQAEAVEAVEGVDADEAGDADEAAESAGGQDGSSANRKRRRRRGGRSNAPKVAAADGTPATQDAGGRAARTPVRGEPGQTSQGHSTNGRGDMSVEVPLDEQGRVAEEFLKGLLSEFGMEASLRVTTSGDEEVKLDLAGSDLGLLIGQKGSTLLAVQDLTRTAVHHKTGAGNGRILVDVGAYRQKRSEALARFAQQLADKVKETGSPTALEPMAAPDRKVVHDALTGVDGVSTISEGEEPRRRVVIVPTTAADV